MDSAKVSTEGPTRMGYPASSGERSRLAGFTILELLFTLMLTVIMLAVASRTYAGYQERTSARRAADLFARDLSFARSTAVRGRETVVVRVDESAPSYEIETVSSVLIAERPLSGGGPVVVDAIALSLTGDSIIFSARGIITNLGGSLGTADFTSGDVVYRVSFNGMGASRVEQQ